MTICRDCGHTVYSFSFSDPFWVHFVFFLVLHFNIFFRVENRLLHLWLFFHVENKLFAFFSWAGDWVGDKVLLMWRSKVFSFADQILNALFLYIRFFNIILWLKTPTAARKLDILRASVSGVFMHVRLRNLISPLNGHRQLRFNHWIFIRPLKLRCLGIKAPSACELTLLEFKLPIYLFRRWQFLLLHKVSIFVLNPFLLFFFLSFTYFVPKCYFTLELAFLDIRTLHKWSYLLLILLCVLFLADWLYVLYFA